jgi:hypothetical protein
MMPQIGKPDIETSGAEKMRHAAAARRVPIVGMEPEPMIRERTMYKEHGGPAVAERAQPVQGELDAVWSGDTSGASGHS